MIRKKQNKHFSKKEVGIFMLNLSPVQKSLLFGHQNWIFSPLFLLLLSVTSLPLSPPSFCLPLPHCLLLPTLSFHLRPSPLCLPFPIVPHSSSLSSSPLSPSPYCLPLLFSLLPSVSVSLLSPTPHLSLSCFICASN